MASPSYSALTFRASQPSSQLPSGRRRPARLAHDGDRLVDPPEDRLLLLEHLHEHLRVAVLGDEQVAREVEVLVGVVALAQPLGGEPEDGRVQALPLDGVHRGIL